ncbi:DUF2252 family protein [Larsenimonas salina]|uniref:DUF2252 family protein n=1 Tax=Larsenimonas salina TaxID=1295565 RepID=UPI002073F384|nr:DUF2252 family protein [Larsenimonas salina]MCM5704073.1 DUF2252 domain-containing protein [Larsenimonas salina]
MTRLLEHHNRARRVLDILDADTAWLSESDRRARFLKMSASPYAFFRGANALYWADVWHDWRFALFGGTEYTQSWLQGDAHVYNFGAYGHHDDAVRYGLDDFDDALIGDYQYDLWRLTISVVLDARENAGLGPDATTKALTHLIAAYQNELARFKQGGVPEAVSLENAPKRLLPFLEKTTRKNSRAALLAKWTAQENGQRRLADRPGKLKRLPAHLASQLTHAITHTYPATRTQPRDGDEAFKVLDTARRIGAGTGSLGIDRFYVLLGNGNVDDDVILDVKAQTPPTAYQRMSDENRALWHETFAHEGERHAAAFRALAEHPDCWLGWLDMDGQVFSVRERSPFKKDYPTHKVKKAKTYRKLAAAWGRILAHSHIRGAHALWPDSPGRFATSVCSQIDARPERFRQVVITQAFAYADCTVRDHRAFLEHRIAALLTTE